MGLFQITIWTTHLNKGISVSDNEIACNWILKKIYNTHWHSDRILPRILVVGSVFIQLLNLLFPFIVKVTFVPTHA